VGSRELSIALVLQDTPLDSVVEEVLNHQGICYDTIRGRNEGKKYPVVIVPAFNEVDSRFGRGLCLPGGEVLAADRVIDLESILRSLSGRAGSEGDRLGLAVNHAEQKLTLEIRRVMSNLGFPLVIKWFWPNGARSCFVLTHDIDWLNYSPFHKVVVQGLSLRQYAVTALKGAAGKEFGWNVSTMIKSYRRHNIKSTVFLRTDYPAGAPVLQSVKMFRESGCEIGLHAAHESHASSRALDLEVDAFRTMTGVNPKGLRFHILKFSVPSTWEILSSCGFEYDATFGYNRRFGFRADVCYPYHPITGKQSRVLELPTCFMDWTALHRKERGKDITTRLQNLMDMVDRYHGVMVVNFHNTYLNSETFPDVMDAYSWLLEQAASKCWVTTAEECVSWWKSREETRPTFEENDDGSWDSRTSVPLAVLEDDGSYTLLKGHNPTIR